MWQALEKIEPHVKDQFWFKVFQGMSPQTDVFIIAILLFTVYFHLRFSSGNASKAPAFLTTLGILGTFVGIAFGLSDFDPNNVQRSVPMLIDGIKTAVWASATGIFCALTIKLREILHSGKKQAHAYTGATAGDVVAVLKEMEESLRSIESAVAGDEASSLLGEIRGGRQDSRAGLESLSRSLEGFYGRMAENNAKALINALNEVIRDFNVKLNEQFGDNFKQLNQAAEKLLVWQQQYSQHMSTVIDQQAVASRNMAEASERYQALVQHAEAFNTVAASMSSLLSGMEQQRGQMGESLSALDKLLTSTATGLPQLEQHIVAMTRQVADGVKTANEEFNRQVAQLIQQTKDQVLVLDKALSEELTRSLESFGRQLASLSEKFASDYGPITERLNALLKIAG